MNRFITEHFDAIEANLIQSPVVTSYQIVRREVASSDGKLRVKATLSDGGLLELFEYVSELNGRVHLLKYSFHWQTPQGILQRRWDNAPHHLNLPNPPHHVHDESGGVHSVTEAPDAFFVLGEIEKVLM